MSFKGIYRDIFKETVSLKEIKGFMEGEQHFSRMESFEQLF
jgi:hypothetical protein